MTNKDDLLKHCWAMFDYWMSSDYQGTSDERFAMMMNGMWSIIKEIGRPEAKFDSFGKQYYISEKVLSKDWDTDEEDDAWKDL